MTIFSCSPISLQGLSVPCRSDFVVHTATNCWAFPGESPAPAYVVRRVPAKSWCPIRTRLPRCRVAMTRIRSFSTATTSMACFRAKSPRRWRRKRCRRLNGEEPRIGPAVNAPAGAWGTHAEPSYRERLEVAKPALQNGKFSRSTAGIYLTRNQLIVAGIVAAVAFMVAFGLGLAVGFLLGTPSKPESSLLLPQLSSAKYDV